VEELQPLFLEEDLLALVERQTCDDRAPLRAPHNQHTNEHEGDNDDREQRDRHRRIVRRSPDRGVRAPPANMPTR